MSPCCVVLSRAVQGCSQSQAAAEPWRVTLHGLRMLAGASRAMEFSLLPGPGEGLSRCPASFHLVPRAGPQGWALGLWPTLSTLGPGVR